ncbi:MAG: Mce-associated rane protein [Mycobacterium sp.]|nr:Mce-associated rane protein [Mycobacterium sp.]
MTNDVRDTAAESTETGYAATGHADADDPEHEAAGSETVTDDDAVPAKRRRRGISPAVRKTIYVLLTVVLLATGGVATWLYFKQYRPDQQTDAEVRQAVVSSASDGTTALLSYSSDTLDQDFANARTHIAGDFLNYYNDFTQQIVAPTAKQRSLKTTAHVTGAAVSELRPDAAVVLVFVDQTTTTKDSPQPSVAVSSLVVHMSRVNDKWLITKFNPV